MCWYSAPSLYGEIEGNVSWSPAENKYKNYHCTKLLRRMVEATDNKILRDVKMATIQGLMDYMCLSQKDIQNPYMELLDMRPTTLASRNGLCSNDMDRGCSSTMPSSHVTI